jgi:hypothetical protein
MTASRRRPVGADRASRGLNPGNGAARTISERPTVAPAAVYVSQHTAPALFGFKTERGFLEFVQAHDVPRTKAGKTVLVEAAALRAVLRRLATIAPEETLEATEERDGDELGSADDVLARLGLRRTA